MARSALLLNELEMARFLDLLRGADRGHVGWSPALASALGKAIFPHAMEFWAALAPMTRRGDGWISLAVPTAARCWPQGAEETADCRFRRGKAADQTSALEAPDEVRVELLTGGWEDANAARAGFAYVAAAAGRVWRRPNDPCGPFEAGARVLSLIAAAILLERIATRDHAITGPGGGGNSAPPVLPASHAAAPEAATGAAPVEAANASGVSGDDIRLLAAFAQHVGPRIIAGAAELHEEGPAVAELATACARIVGFLTEDRADRIAALLDAEATTAARHAEVLDLAKERRRRALAQGDDTAPPAA